MGLSEGQGTTRIHVDLLTARDLSALEVCVS